MDISSLINRVSNVTMVAVSVGLALHLLLPKNTTYFSFEVEERFLPIDCREDKRPKLEIRRCDILLAGILFATLQANRHLRR